MEDVEEVRLDQSNGRATSSFRWPPTTHQNRLVDEQGPALLGTQRRSSAAGCGNLATPLGPQIPFGLSFRCHDGGLRGWPSTNNTRVAGDAVCLLTVLPASMRVANAVSDCRPPVHTREVQYIGTLFTMTKSAREPEKPPRNDTVQASFSPTRQG